MPLKEEQRTNKQHAVPQNIMDVEFKIVGDLTMRQFVYLAISGGIAYLCYLFVPAPFKWLLILPVVLLGISLAFIPLQERGLDQWIINFFRSVYSPSQRVWRRELYLPTAFLYQNIAVVKQELITLTPTSSRRKLEEYLEVQEGTKVVDKLDIPEMEYLQKVRDAFGPRTTAPPQTIAAPPRTTVAPVQAPKIRSPIQPQITPPKIEEQKAEPPSATKKPEIVTPVVKKEPIRKEVEIKEDKPVSAPPKPPQEVEKPKVIEKPLPSKPISAKVVSTPSKEVPQKKEFPVEKKPVPTKQPVSLMQRILAKKKVSPAPPKKEATMPQQYKQHPKKPEISPPPSMPVDRVEHKKEVIESIREEKVDVVKDIPTPPQKAQEEPVEEITSEIIKPKFVTFPEKQEFALPRKDSRERPLLTPITPDRHSGRRFVHLTPEQGWIDIPIRGHKVIKPSKDTGFEEDADAKAAQLKNIMRQVKKDKAYREPVSRHMEFKKQKAKSAVDSAKKPTEVSPKLEISEEKKRAEEEKKKEEEKKEMSRELERQKALLAAEKQTIEDVPEVKPGVDISKLPPKTPPATAPPPPVKKQPVFSDKEPLSDVPNIISGIVRDAGGSMLENVVLIIKNDKGEPVRALKTNIFGQFLITTPLPNGVYTIEVDKMKKTNFSFDIISVELKGKVLPPMEFIGR